MITDKAREKMTGADVAQGFSETEKNEVARAVGLAALKFADLQNHFSRDYVFDLERFSSFDGCTGPYLLYTCARIKSILRKANNEGLAFGEILPPYSDIERKILLKIADLPEVVDQAFGKRSPSHLCEYVYDLAGLFAGFYHQHHVLSETDKLRQGSWLTLAHFVMMIVEMIIKLLGMESVEGM